jgi:hypothetical protein
MRLRGVSLVLVLLAMLLAASSSAPPAWAGSCHTTHASFYYWNDRDESVYLGRRSVEATYDWKRMGCVPYKCKTRSLDSDATTFCPEAIKRYGCPSHNPSLRVRVDGVNSMDV